ncbi:MAG TPA: M14 family metallopeptidase [Burkholderiales bacterium]|nr:M14 family metallopeptidase [Burkholderiales bacterium]
MKYRIEIKPPNISRYRSGNTGVDYVHVMDSGKPGPNVMVQALTHGNEFSGAIALDYLFGEKVKPLKGKLTLGFANVAAFERFDFSDPDRSRCIDEDYNRLWADAVLLGPRDSAELRRARELRPFVDAADYLLDLHTMTEPCRPIMVCGMLDKGAEFARRVGVPADLLIDTGHPAGLRMRDRGGFGDPASPKNALLIEAGQHWEKSSVDVAIDTMLRFLRVTGLLDEAFVKSRLRLTPPAKQCVVRVTEPITALSTRFRFAQPWKGLEVLPKAGTVVAMDGDRIWRTPYDRCVLVMPSTAHVKPGNTMVRLGRYD